MMAPKQLFCGAASVSALARSTLKTMSGAMTAFAIALGGTSLICCALVARLQNRRRAGSRSSRDSYGADTGSGNDAGDGTSHLHSTGNDNSGSDSSGHSSDSGDSGGGGDGGGGND
jgi:hypothetical protein